jgi:NitT/TauT family transport system permease protein
MAEQAQGPVSGQVPVPANDRAQDQQPAPHHPAPAETPRAAGMAGAKAVPKEALRPSAPLRSREPIWSLRKPLPRSLQLWLGLLLPLTCLALWVLLTAGPRPVIGPLFLPSPVEVLKVLLRDLVFGKATTENGHPEVVRVLLDAAWVSTLRITVAFFIATAVAVPLGILMGAFEPVNRLIDPVMAPLRYMPISAFIPLTILWFGIGESQKLAFLFLGVFVYLLPVVISAIRAVPEELVQTARTLGASRLQVITSVLVPAALPDIFDSFRVMNAISWTYVILAEFVNTTRGLGYLIKLAGDRLKTAEMFAGVIIIGIIGLCTDALIRGVGQLLFPWREGERV